MVTGRENDANDTRALIQRLVEIRARQAQLLGFEHYAAWKISDQMAKTPEAALNFMREIVPAARERALTECADIQQVIDDEQGDLPLKHGTGRFMPNRFVGKNMLLMNLSLNLTSCLITY